MKVQNRSFKSYSSFKSVMTINCCLLTYIIVLQSVTCISCWTIWSSSAKSAHPIVNETIPRVPLDPELDFEPEFPDIFTPSQDSSTIASVNSSDSDHQQIIIYENIIATNSTLDEPTLPSVVANETTDENGWLTVTCTGCQFSCHSKRLCVEPHLVCDGINDCDDGSDEFSCLDPMFGPVYPNEGQYKNRCCLRADFNDEVCTKEKVPLLIFSKLDNLYKINLSEYSKKIKTLERQMNETLTGHLNKITSFEYRTSDDLLIWLNPFENKIFTGKVNLEQIYRSPIFEPKEIVSQRHKIHGFVYDWLNFNIIWIDDYGIRSERISLSNFAPRNQTKTYRIFKPSYEKPGSMTIDVKKQYIFWINRGADPMRPHAFPVYIERIDIQSEPKIKRIVETNIVRPVGLAVCTENVKLYWIDGFLRTLNSIEYDGTNRITLYESLPFIYHIFSMDIHSNYLYFTTDNYLTFNPVIAIQRIHLNNTNTNFDYERNFIYETGFSSSLYFKIIDPIKQYDEDFFVAKNMIDNMTIL